ncbi:beta-lactamase family [Fusarium coicis]|nr:beta-lactamase family [Fusarium coicis]
MMSYCPVNVHDAVASLEPQMDYIYKVSGTTGLWLSVVSGRKEAYAKHFGFRGPETKEAPDGDTTYLIDSVTKGMVAVLLGTLVEEGKLGWSTRVASILPELQDSFDGRGSEITIADLLSHQTGVARSDALWISRAGNILLPKSESLRTWAAQPVFRDFRSDFLYNNYAYDVVGQSIEMVERKSLEGVFGERVWKPRGIPRTSMEDLAGNTNAEKAYYAQKDASSYEVPIHPMTQNHHGSGFMRAVNHQFNHKMASTPDSPFKQLTTILRPHNQLDLTSSREQSYSLGWGRVQLTCPLGTLTYNYLLIPSMPLIGQGESGQLTLYHGGSI